MCAKTPKPKKVEEKPVQYLRNPFLDDVAIGRDTGRAALRIDLAAPGAAGSTPAASASPVRLGLPGSNPQAAKRAAQGAFAPFLGGYVQPNYAHRGAFGGLKLQ